MEQREKAGENEWGIESPLLRAPFSLTAPRALPLRPSPSSPHTREEPVHTLPPPPAALDRGHTMAAVDAPMDTGLEAAVFGDAADDLPSEFATMTADEIGRRARLLANEVRVLKDEATRLGLEQANLNEKVREEG